MPIRLSEYMYFEPRKRGEGLRIGCTRYLVRGQRKRDHAKKDIMDVWLPTLAPSAKLIKWAKVKNVNSDDRSWMVFLNRYRSEMMKTGPRQTIRTFAKVAKTLPISVGCYCGGDRCHRFELERLIRKAAVGRF